MKAIARFGNWLFHGGTPAMISKMLVWAALCFLLMAGIDSLEPYTSVEVDYFGPIDALAIAVGFGVFFAPLILALIFNSRKK